MAVRQKTYKQVKTLQALTQKESMHPIGDSHLIGNSPCFNKNFFLNNHNNNFRGRISIRISHKIQIKKIHKIFRNDFI